jgi:hypothetical protein
MKLNSLCDGPRQPGAADATEGGFFPGEQHQGLVAEVLHHGRRAALSHPVQPPRGGGPDGVYSTLASLPCKGVSLASLGVAGVTGVAATGGAGALVMSWARPDRVLRMGLTLSQSMRSVIW